jgi:tetratricopeptide (TPR) repeat protein
MRRRADKGGADGAAGPGRQIALPVVLLALLAAGVAAICSSDRAEEWRLRRMSAAELEAAVRERSWDPLLLYQLGLAREHQRDRAGAAVAFARAAGADPAMARAQRMLGQQLAALGRLPESEAALRRAVQLDPRDRTARLALGELYRRVGALGPAITLFQDLARREPSWPEALYQLAECYGEKFESDRCLALLEQVVRRAPEVPRYQAALGSAYLYYGRLEDAGRCFRRALRQAPADPEIHYGWGRALVEQADDAALAEAGRELAVAARLRPEHADTHMALGQLALRRGDLARARTELETAIRLGHFEDRTLLLLGQTLLRLRDEAGGRRMLAAYHRTTDLNRGIVQLENRLRNAPGDRAVRLRLARLYAADGQPERGAYQDAQLRGGGGPPPAGRRPVMQRLPRERLPVSGVPRPLIGQP